MIKLIFLLFLEGTDFSLVTTSADFVTGLGNGETMNVMVMVTDEMLVEGTESYILSVSLSSGPASIGAMDTVTLNIADNDGRFLGLHKETF